MTLMTYPAIIKDKDNNEVAQWYNTHKGFIVEFETLDPDKCKAIVQLILNELILESEEQRNEISTSKERA